MPLLFTSCDSDSVAAFAFESLVAGDDTLHDVAAAAGVGHGELGHAGLHNGEA